MFMTIFPIVERIPVIPGTGIPATTPTTGMGFRSSRTRTIRVTRTTRTARHTVRGITPLRIRIHTVLHPTGREFDIVNNFTLTDHGIAPIRTDRVRIAAVGMDTDSGGITGMDPAWGIGTGITGMPISGAGCRFICIFE